MPVQNLRKIRQSMAMPAAPLPQRAPGFGPRPSRVLDEIKAYEPVSSLPRMIDNPDMEHFKLDWNECTIAPSPSVKKAVMHYLDGEIGLNYYPELFSTELRFKLQQHVGFRSDHIMVTNGSDDALELVCKSYLDPGDVVLSPYPTYTHAILFAKSRGAEIEKVLYDDPFTGDLDAILSRIRPETKLIYLVNPNNPTGVMYEPDELAELAEAAPQAIILIDEAYIEFAEAPDALELVSRFSNVIVSRTFSKAYGLAALRVGYLIAQPEITRVLGKLYNPKSVNQLAQVAAAAVIDDLPYYKRYIEEVIKSKQLFGRWCRHHGLTFRDSPGNFVMVQVENVKDVVAELAEEGVYVRDRSSMEQLEGHFRLNLGTVEQTTAVLKRFERVLKKLEILD